MTSCEEGDPGVEAVWSLLTTDAGPIVYGTRE
jgi:hypothetical protein